MADEDRTLPDILDSSWEIWKDLEKSTEPSSSNSFQAQVLKAMEQLERATMMVNELDLYSTNEAISEIPTNDIRYIILPALLGDLTMKVVKEERPVILERAKTYWKDFMARCKSYGITEEEIPEEPSPHKTGDCGPPNLMAMQANRAAKIQRYKAQKETESKMNALGTWKDIRKKDDEVQREFYILLLKKWVLTAIDQLSSIYQEEEILQHMKKRSKDAEKNNEGAVGEKPKKLPARNPMKPFILTRDKVQAQVFGAGYPSIPTMTLDEFYEKEVREGKIQLNSRNPTKEDEAQQKLNLELKKEREVETDDPDYLKKARDMDEYKDDHKRGWGNRENMG